MALQAARDDERPWYDVAEAQMPADGHLEVECAQGHIHLLEPHMFGRYVSVGDPNRLSHRAFEPVAVKRWRRV